MRTFLIFVSVGLASWAPSALAETETLPQPEVDSVGFAASRSVESATLGRTTAGLSYDLQSPDSAGLHLVIRREGQSILDQDVTPSCDGCLAQPGGYGRRRSIAVLNLDTGEEPEVVVDVYSGGAHCCHTAYIYRYESATKNYLALQHHFGDAGYRLVDLGSDGTSEFRSSDFRFAFVFTAFGFSRFPIQNWSYRGGPLVDVTRSYPRLIRANARSQLKEYKRFRNRNYDVRGVLAAYVADQYLLGRAKAGWRVVRRAIHRGEIRRSGSSGRGYVRKLRRFLKRRGYVR
jgi:hypothetical protein